MQLRIHIAEGLRPRKRIVARHPRLTLANRASYHPPDDERADALMWALGAFVCLMGSDVDPGPSGEDRAQSR